MSLESEVRPPSGDVATVALTVTCQVERITDPKAVPTADDDVVDRLVIELNELQSRATLNLAIRMGALIIERVYGGDLSTWREHRAKETSFRRLAARSRRDLRVSPTFLYRAVALYELTRRLGERAVAGLTMTHLRVVLGLPDDEQARLLGAAATQSWSSERLEREAVRVRAMLVNRRGRPPSPPLVKAVRKLVSCWNDVEASLGSMENRDLSSTELQRVRMTVSDITQRLERLGRHLAARGRSSPEGAP
jgi:HTH domain found in ParB protein